MVLDREVLRMSVESSGSAGRRVLRNGYTWVGTVFVVSVLMAYLVLHAVMKGCMRRVQVSNQE
jgi:hypothetical protein